MKFLFIVLLFIGCVSEKKVERDAHGSIIREDPFADDKLFKKKAEDARTNSRYGIAELSNNCDKIPLSGDAKGFALVLKCSHEILVRLKMQCEFTQVVGLPFYKPVKFREFQVNIANIDKSFLKDPKRFPTNVTTDHDGILDFSFGTTGPLTNFHFEITDQKSGLKVSTEKMGNPIVMPASFCSKN